MIWVKFVYDNLPKNIRNDYANTWNIISEKELNQCEFIVARIEDYKLAQNEEIKTT